MAGYTRQSLAQILNGEIVSAPPLNAEFNQILAAFNNSTGHKHDGTAAEGPPIDRIADSDQNNLIFVDTSANQINFYVESSAASVGQISIQDGAIVPFTDNDIDLGSSSFEFKDLYIDGTANIDSLVADTADINAGTIDNTVIGATTLLRLRLLTSPYQPVALLISQVLQSLMVEPLPLLLSRAVLSPASLI
jgi:hypothetical protein